MYRRLTLRLCCSKVHEHTSADVEGLKAGDTITMVGDEFICGMPMKEAKELLSGKASSIVHVTVSRVTARIKSRLCFHLVRDWGHRDLDLSKEARRRDERALRHADRLQVEKQAQEVHDRFLAEKQEQDKVQSDDARNDEAISTRLFKKTQTKAQRRGMPTPTEPQSRTEALPSLESPAISWEANERKRINFMMDTGRAELGILYSTNHDGLVVAGFVKDSVAASSGLQVKDLITMAGDNFLAGLSAVECFALMTGEIRSEVELTVIRMVDGARTRLTIPVQLDVPAAPRKADLGIAYRQDANGLRVTGVYKGTSAFDLLQKNDVITGIALESDSDVEFIAGMPLAEVQELISGPAGAKVFLTYSRVDAKTNFKKRCSNEFMFDYNPRVADLGDYSALGNVGIEYKSDKLGMKVTGFQKGTSVASSELQIGDIICAVNDEIVSGLPANMAFGRMSGPRDTQIEIVACRKSVTGAKIRVSAFVSRDVGTMPKIARPGFEVEVDAGGLRIVDVVAGTAAAETGLQPGDLIFQIDDNFIAGLGMQEAWSQLWGDFGSSVDISASRQANNMKSRVSCAVERDHNSSIQISKKPPPAIISKLKNLPAMVSTLNTPVQNKSKRKKKSGGSGYFLVALVIALLAFLMHKCTTLEQCNSAVLHGMQTLHEGYISVQDSPHIVKTMKHFNHGYKSMASAGASVVPAISDRAIQAFKAVANASAFAAPGITYRAKAIYKAAPAIVDRVSTSMYPSNTSYVAGAVSKVDTIYTMVLSVLQRTRQDDAVEGSAMSPLTKAVARGAAQSTSPGEGRADKTAALSPDPGPPVASGLVQTVSQKAKEFFQTVVRKSLPLWSSGESHEETGPALSVVDDAMRRIEEARKAMEVSSAASGTKEL